MTVVKSCRNQNGNQNGNQGGVKKSEKRATLIGSREGLVFQVREFSGECREELANIVGVWNRVAGQNINLVSSRKKKDILANSEFVTRHIVEGLKNENPRVFACKDASDELQSIALVKRYSDGLYVDYLAANPRNIVPVAGESQVRGAGTAVMRHLFRVCVKERLGLSLYSLKEASSFYKKNKLRFVESGVSGSGYMSIDEKKIRKIFATEEKKVHENLLRAEGVKLGLSMQKYLGRAVK